jgi:D-amino-acid oxidase
MPRRHLLRSLFGIAAVGDGQKKSTPSSYSEAPFRLPHVQISADRIIGELVGLRPYRPGGFVVRPEVMNGKLVIHNYGHGGCGLGFSWGTSQLAVEEALKTDSRECAVLGCGAVGISTGILLQRHGFKVIIYARDLPPNTTSNIAGGLWSPYFVCDESNLTPAFREQFQAAARHAHRHFRNMAGSQYGVRWVDCYFTADEKVEVPSYIDDLTELFPRSADLGPGEHPFPRRNARRSGTMQIQTPRYMRAIEQDFRTAGGRIVVREFRNLQQVLELAESTVINCTGLGSRDLFGDKELLPAKGQMTVLLPQPEINYILGIDGEALYMIPRDDGILLGGTFERDVWDLAPNPREAERILQGHSAFFERMKREGRPEFRGDHA